MKKIHCTKDEHGIRPGVRTVYSYDEPNDRGEVLIVELRRGNVREHWAKEGRVPRGVQHWIACDVAYHDAEGIAWGGQKQGYDPTMRKATPAEQGKVTGCGYMVDFDWVLEDAPENREKLLREIETRFYGTTDTERTVRDAQAESN